MEDRLRALIGDAMAGGHSVQVDAIASAHLVDLLSAARHPHHRGITVQGATFGETLDLDDLRFDAPLRFERCQFSAGITLNRAELRSLELTSCQVAAIPNLEDDRNETGTTDQAERPDEEQPDGGDRADDENDFGQERSSVSVVAHEGRLAASLTLRDTHLTGAVKARGLSIGGRVKLDRCSIGDPMVSLDLEEARIDRETSIEHCDVSGCINLDAARLGGRLDISDTRLGSHEGMSITTHGLHTGGGMRISGETCRLRGAVTGVETTIDGWLHITGGAQVGCSDDRGWSVNFLQAAIAGAVVVSGETTALTGGLRVFLSGITSAVVVGEGASVGSDCRSVSLDLQRSTIGSNLVVRGAGTTLAGSIVVAQATIDGELGVSSGASVRLEDEGIGVLGDGASIAGDVNLHGPATRIGGSVALRGARIGGDLSIRAGVLIGANSGGNGSPWSVSADAAVIDGDVVVNGDDTSIGAGISMTGVRVTGYVFVGGGVNVQGGPDETSFDAGGGSMSSILVVDAALAGGLDLYQASVAGDVALRGSTSLGGGVILGSSIVRGSVWVSAATIGRWASGSSISAASCRVDGPLRVADGATLDGPIDVSHGELRSIEVDSGARIGGDEGVGIAAAGARFRNLIVGGAGTHVDGHIQLFGANVDGGLSVSGGARIGVDDEGLSVSAPNSSIRSNITLRSSGTELAGGIDLFQADVGGGVFASDCVCIGADVNGSSIRGLGLTAQGSVLVSSAAHLVGAIWLEGATVSGELTVEQGARVGRNKYDLSLVADNAHVGRNLTIAGAGTTLAGAVSLLDARIQGLFAVDAGATVGAGEDGNSIFARLLQTSGNLTLQGDTTTLEGGLHLSDARVGGRVALRHGLNIGATDGTSVEAQGLTSHDILFGHVRLDGGVDLRHASVPGRLSIQDDTEVNVARGELALVIAEADIDVLELAAARWSGTCDLSDTSVRLLRDRPAFWWNDDDVRSWTLRGFRAAQFPDPLDFSTASRLEWLGRTGPDRDLPADQATYRSVAAALASHGSDDDATEVLIDMRRRHDPPWLRRALAPIGQGYRPLRTLWVFAALFLLALALATVGASAGWFATAAPDGSAMVQSDDCGGLVTCLRPLVYATDLIVPVVELGEVARWQPATRTGPWGILDPLGAALVLLRLAGWAFGGLLVIGALGLVIEQRQSES